ncbi:MAG: aminotransferase class V-fold PLP-dependent enzyme [Rhodospirillales bacterium]|jgi:selenocysteine lyase/cysteine desulfurase|nr:aminotransferase class V-fold PLP-dependent enzyme [Rhodospirillales bacterium]
MLPSQRALFAIPREVCYLNAAAWGPLPLRSQDAGRVGVARKGQPWTLEPDFAARQFARARSAAARLIGADPDDVALISSVSYGVATAAKLLRLPAGSRILLLEDDHSSPVLEWLTRAEEAGLAIEIVPRPADGDWTAALLEAIARPGAPPALASISSVHWSDGGAIDLADVSAALHACGAALLVDATHGAGVMPLDVGALDPDFLVFPTYKWVLGPYGRAFLYVARRRQEGVPLEQTAYGRRGVDAAQTKYLADIGFVAGARRFDMGERDHFISLEMASIGMEMVAEWGAAAISERLAALTGRLADGIRDTGVALPDVRVRAPHILSLAFPHGLPVDLMERLAAGNAHVAARLGRMRISPHVYNDEEDIDRFVTMFRALMRT